MRNTSSTSTSPSTRRQVIIMNSRVTTHLADRTSTSRTLCVRRPKMCPISSPHRPSLHCSHRYPHRPLEAAPHCFVGKQRLPYLLQTRQQLTRKIRRSCVPLIADEVIRRIGGLWCHSTTIIGLCSIWPQCSIIQQKIMQSATIIYCSHFCFQYL